MYFTEFVTLIAVMVAISAVCHLLIESIWLAVVSSFLCFVAVGIVLQDGLVSPAAAFLVLPVGLYTYSLALSNRRLSAASGGVLALLIVAVALHEGSVFGLFCISVIYAPCCFVLTIAVSGLRARWASLVVALVLLGVVGLLWWNCARSVWGEWGPFF